MQYRYLGERTMNLAAIDIGTNSCRLLVSRVFINPQRRSYLKLHASPIVWKSIDSFCRIVRLGEGLTKTGALEKIAIQKTLEALYACYKKICYYRVSHLRIVATEACRRAQNSQELLFKARELYNLSIDIIDSSQEVQFALLGCSEMLNWKKPYVLLFDIGGGSTEVLWVKLNTENRFNYLFNDYYTVLDSMSLPYGVVTVNDNLDGYVSKEQIFEKVYHKVKADMARFVEKNRIAEINENLGVQMIGSSGTVTTFGAIYLGLEQYDRRKIDGLMIPTEKMINLCSNLKDYEKFFTNNDFARRADLMNVGAGILLGIFESSPVKVLTIADRGVREGIIVDLIRNHIVPHFQVIENKKIIV